MRSAEGLSPHREISPRSDMAALPQQGAAPLAPLCGYPCTPTKKYTRRWRLYHFCGFYYPIREVIPIAIYHWNVGIVSRGKGKSAVAAAAYRSGEKLTNEWDGMTHDYTRKGGVVHTEIMLPPHALPSFSDRSTLWNSVELYEKAGNAQLAREIDAALPIELSREEQIRLVREYCSSQFVSRGMCVDFAIHDTDSGNPHCHIMLTMRPLDGRGAWAAKSKKEYDLDENGERIRLPSGRYKTHKIDLTGWNDKDNTLLWRKAWADYGLTVDRAQELGERFCKEQFPGHQALVCTHPGGHNHSGNIHVHIVINSLRIEDVPLLPYMDRPADTKAGCKHRCTDAAMEHFRAEVMELCHRENLYQIDLLHGSANRITEREYWAKKKGQFAIDRENEKRLENHEPLIHSKFETDKEKLRKTIRKALDLASGFDEFSSLLLQEGVTVKESRGRCSFSALGTSGAAGFSTSAWVTASAGSGTVSPISKSAACPSCSSMTASASVSTGSGAGCSGITAFPTAGAGASAGGTASGIFFLSSAICKPPFCGMKKSQSADWPGGNDLPSWFYI